MGSDPVFGQRIAEASAEAMWSRDVAAKHLGMRLEWVRLGAAEMTMTIREEMSNGHGICHGGYIFTLADTCMAYAGNSRNAIAVAQTASVTYLSPGKLGERLTATAEERSHAGRTGVYDVTVRGEDGRAVAVFRGITQRIKGEVAPGLGVVD
jgi:acyl-CoA thioesterase